MRLKIFKKINMPNRLVYPWRSIRFVKSLKNYIKCNFISKDPPTAKLEDLEPC